MHALDACFGPTHYWVISLTERIGHRSRAIGEFVWRACAQRSLEIPRLLAQAEMARGRPNLEQWPRTN